MPKFENKEEYEKWKAQRLRELQEKKQTSDVPPEPQGEGSPGDRGEDKIVIKVPLTKEIEALGGLSGVGDLFRSSWEIYKRRIFTLISLYILSVLFFAVSFGIFFGIAYLFAMVFEVSKATIIVTGVVTGAVAGLITFFWGFTSFILAIIDESIGVKDALGRGWYRIGSFIWLFSLSGFIITGGFLLFLIPGVIFLVWFAFGQFILASDDERGMNALLKSKEYVRGQWFDVFLRLFVVWLVSVGIGIVPIIGPILSIFYMPFMMIFTYLVYIDLRALKGDVACPTSTGVKLKWIGAGTLGYLVLPIFIIAFLGVSLTIPLLALKGMMTSQKQKIITAPEKWPHGDVLTQQSPPSFVTPEPFQKPDDKKTDAKGEAIIVREGVYETFTLKTGFFSETRFSDPKRASIEFHIPAEPYSNARKIEMILDTTKAGKHFADGKAINDSMFGRSQLNIGELSSYGFIASFKYIADGGQIFPPKDSCTIVIASPYTGDQEGIFEGEVYDCTVHSAGIDYNISSIKFRMRGVSSR